MNGSFESRGGALLGVVAAPLFLAGVILVSWLERDFMAGLGWDVWPSGTALGPHGWITVVVLVATGACQMAFASSLLRQAGRSRLRKAAGILLLVSGLGMGLLAFKTDPPGAESTWHGIAHYAAYLVFLLALVLAYVVLTWGSWGRLDRSSWKFAPLALVPWLGVFVLPDGLEPGSYLFFAVLLTPLTILAIRVLATGGWPADRRSA